VPYTYLKTHRFVVGKLPQSLDKLHHFQGVAESTMCRWRHDVCTRNDMPDSSYFRCIFCRRQYPSVSRLGSLRHLQLDHFDIGPVGLFGIQIPIKVALFVTTAKIACTDLPDKVSPIDMVIADPSLSCIMGKIL